MSRPYTIQKTPNGFEPIGYMVVNPTKAVIATTWTWRSARKIADALNAAPAVKFVERLAAEGCQNFTSEWTCHKSGRIPFADYGADAMCDPCIARLALGGQ